MIQNLSVRYHPELPFVLKSISLEIAPGERVGLVGRTGAGKSSLLLALFRLIETPEQEIFIDGLDITSITLGSLRSALGFVP